MRTEPLVLRVGPHGRIRAASASARRIFGETHGRACRTVVAARRPRSGEVCGAGCVQRVLEGEESPGGFVMVRGEPHKMQCTCVGDEVVVHLKSGGTDASPEQLTDREREVLACVALGHTSKEIGVTLGISAGTVRTHTERARRKLGSRTRAQAVAVASGLGLLD